MIVESSKLLVCGSASIAVSVCACKPSIFNGVFNFASLSNLRSGNLSAQSRSDKQRAKSILSRLVSLVLALMLAATLIPATALGVISAKTNGFNHNGISPGVGEAGILVDNDEDANTSESAANDAAVAANLDASGGSAATDTLANSTNTNANYSDNANSQAGGATTGNVLIPPSDSAANGSQASGGTSAGDSNSANGD